MNLFRGADRRGTAWQPAALLAVLLAFFGLLLASASKQSATADEPLHATGGYTYWKFNDYRIQQENSGNGILPQRWFALPLLTGEHRFPPATSAAWRDGNGFILADEWFHQMGNDTLAMLSRGRFAAAVIAVLLALVVWHCSRQLFGERGAWISLLTCVLNPGILANGPLMTSDVTAALFFLAAVSSWWALLDRFTAGRLVLSGAATAGVFLSKSSAPVLIPCLVILGILRLVDGRPLPLGQRNLGRAGQFGLLAGLAVLHAAVVYAAIWGTYGFRYALCSDPEAQATTGPALWTNLLPKTLVDAVDELELPRATEQAVRRAVDRHVISADESDEAKAEVLASIKQTLLTPEQARQLDARLAAPDFASLPTRAILWARAHEALPEGYLLAYLHMWRNSRGRRGFLNGEFSIYGRAWYFPYTFLIKTPLPTLALLGLALAAGVARRRQSSPAERRFYEAVYRTAPLWTLVGVYGAVALSSRLNIGHRHLLPLYPPLFILCGAAAAGLSTRRTAHPGVPARGLPFTGFAAVILVAVQCVEVAYRFPHYLAYFNGIVRPADAYRHVTDSSVDWGQDLPGVKQYLDRHAQSGRFYLSYYGAGDPATYGIEARYLPSTPGLFMGDRAALRWEPLPATDPAVAAQTPPATGYEVVGVDLTPPAPRRLLIKTREALQLTPGTYLISATMLQTPWDERAENTYQRLRGVVEPFVQSDLDTRRANIVRVGAERWQEALQSWEIARFARLTAFLRQREPDANIGYSILVYRLTAEDVTKALNGTLARGS